MRELNFKKMLFTSLTVAACLMGCSQGEGLEGASTLKTSVHLDVACKTVPLTDSLVLDLLGPDTFHVVLGKDETAYDKLLNAGEWTFAAKLYANGMLVQQGETATELSSGGEVVIPIAMHAVAGFLFVQIPLGFENQPGVASGILTISAGEKSTDYDFVIADGFATATTEMLALGETYRVQIKLKSKAGSVLYEMDSQVMIDGENFAQSWSLKTLQVEVSLSIVSDSLKTLTATAFIPSKLRKVQSGDLLITEFQTETKAEFVEYYNATIDTLDLSGCSLYATSSSSVKAVTEPLESVKILPNSYLVFGTDSLEGRDVLATLNMPGTKGSIVFRCEGVAVDSFYYVSSKTQDLDPEQYGAYDPFAITSNSKQSLQLPLKNYKKRSAGSAWCKGEISLHENASCEE